jgi:glycine oxidase
LPLLPTVTDLSSPPLSQLAQPSAPGPLSPLTGPAAPAAPVLVLGAGLMGRLLAVALAQRGHAVRVVDASGPDGQGAAARVAAAMLAPLAESAVTEPSVVAMGQYALARWPQLLATLAQPVFFQQNGTLILWHRQDQPEARRFAQQLAHTTHNLPNLPQPQTLDAAGIHALEPALEQRFHQGYYLPEEGQLDNRELLAALGATLLELGVSVQWNTPMTLAEAQAEQARQGGWVLDCRGLGAQGDTAKSGTGMQPLRGEAMGMPPLRGEGLGMGLGMQPLRGEGLGMQPLRGVRGEVVRLHAPDVHLSRPTRLLHPRYPIYIAPKPNGVYVVGATEIETSDASPASVRSVLELLSACYAVHPGFGEARILELNTQRRPTLPDNLPAVVEAAPQLLQINGLYRHGFLIAPALLDAVLQHMQGSAPALAQSWGLRFLTLSSSEARA